MQKKQDHLAAHYVDEKNSVMDALIKRCYQTDLLTQEEDLPQKSMLLQTPEIKEFNPSWETIELTLQALAVQKSRFEGHHFCVLEYVETPLNYIQTVFHFPAKAWRLEARFWHPDGSYEHYFARLPGEKKQDCISDMVSLMNAFRVFYYSGKCDDLLEWVPYDI